MADNVIVCLILKHSSVEGDVMKILIIFFVFKVVHYCQFWRVIL